jgi:hypothetical protein
MQQAPPAHDNWLSSLHIIERENQQLVTHEPAEFENEPVEVGDSTRMYRSFERNL